MPPDKDMGIWREVFVGIRRRFAAPALSLPLSWSDEQSAQLTGKRCTHQHHGSCCESTLQVDLADVQVSQAVKLAAKETKTVRLTPSSSRNSSSSIPACGGPINGRTLSRTDAKFHVAAGGADSDSAVVKFGIRESPRNITGLQYPLVQDQRKERTDPRCGMGTGHAPAVSSSGLTPT